MSFLNSINLDAWRVWAPLGIAGIIVWTLWLYRVVSSRFARPVVNDFRTTTSVVVPSYREDPDILISAWPLARRGPDRGHRRGRRRRHRVPGPARRGRRPRLRTIVFEHEGKRSALGVGIRAAVGEIVVLSDSDTLWTAGLLDAVQMPFVDPTVGAVGTQQNVYQRTTQRLAPHRRLDGRPPLLRLRAGDGPQGRGDLRVRAHGGVPALGRSCPCCPTSSTSSSSAAAASPATTAG